MCNWNKKNGSPSPRRLCLLNGWVCFLRLSKCVYVNSKRERDKLQYTTQFRFIDKSKRKFVYSIFFMENKRKKRLRYSKTAVFTFAAVWRFEIDRMVLAAIILMRFIFILIGLITSMLHHTIRHESVLIEMCAKLAGIFVWISLVSKYSHRFHAGAMNTGRRTRSIFSHTFVLATEKSGSHT